MQTSEETFEVTNDGLILLQIEWHFVPDVINVKQLSLAPSVEVVDNLGKVITFAQFFTANKSINTLNATCIDVMNIVDTVSVHFRRRNDLGWTLSNEKCT